MSINYHRKTFLRFTTENHFICKIAISKILVKGNKKPANGVTSECGCKNIQKNSEKRSGAHYKIQCRGATFL